MAPRGKMIHPFTPGRGFAEMCHNQSRQCWSLAEPSPRRPVHMMARTDGGRRSNQESTPERMTRLPRGGDRRCDRRSRRRQEGTGRDRGGCHWPDRPRLSQKLLLVALVESSGLCIWNRKAKPIKCLNRCWIGQTRFVVVIVGAPIIRLRLLDTSSRSMDKCTSS